MVIENTSIRIDAIILDDDEQVCEVLADLFRGFHVWGEVYAFRILTKRWIFATSGIAGWRFLCWMCIWKMPPPLISWKR